VGDTAQVPPVLDDDLLAAYLATEVVDDDGVVWSGSGAARELAVTWVLTAENPFSEVAPGDVNDAAMRELEREIVASGAVAIPLVGRASDHSWSERCFGVRDVGREAVCAWGRDRGQHAVFLLTPDEQVVVSCWTGADLTARPRAC
jgi:hypothetical protein